MRFVMETLVFAIEALEDIPLQMIHEDRPFPVIFPDYALSPQLRENGSDS